MKKEPTQAVTIVEVVPRLWNVERTAAYLGVSPWTVRAYVANGFLRPVKLPSVRQTDDHGRPCGENNRRYLFDRVDLDAFIEKQKREGGA